LVQQRHSVAGFIRAFVSAPLVPELGVALQVIPFGFVSDWYRVTNVAAKRFTVRVVWSAFQTTIDGGGGSVEGIIETAKIHKCFWAWHIHIVTDEGQEIEGKELESCLTYCIPFGILSTWIIVKFY
jgi:hypothetical protein